MEIIFNVISLTLLIGLFLSPIFIVWRLNRFVIRYNFIIYLTFGILTTLAIALTFGWWTDYSDNKLLEHFGYNVNAMNDKERFEKVSPDNMEKVKSIERSLMGIGWPLKVILTYVFYSPYLLIVYLVTYLFRNKTKTTDKN